MKKIQILNRYSNEVLFEYECKDNTILKTVEKAIVKNADLRSANLRSADLRSADLRSANLSYADLRSADLSYADLRSANLSSANLSSADLRSAYLSYADLRSADLSYADLRSADLRSANLSYADLRSADLSYADLRSANLSSANLSSADLRSANLSSADINKIKHLYQIIPEIGQFIAWKKASGQVVKIQIPAKAKRTCNLINRKCRAEYIKTLDIQNIDGSKSGIKKVLGDHDGKTVYEVGKITKADSFDDSVLIDCSHGIHFFITRKEAEDW